MTEEANAHALLSSGRAFNNLPAGQRQLFLDDDDVARTENLRMVFHQPQKRGAVIRREPALGGNPEIRCSPVWDPHEQVWKLWTICVTPEELHGIAGLSGYHESRDGLHWYQPILRQAEYLGTRENNLVYIPMGDGCSAEILGAVYDRSDPDPNRRYKAMSFTMAPELAILFATSPDGIHWTRVDFPPIASGDEPNFSLDERNRLFIATVKVSGPFGRSHALTVSDDFENWSEPQLVFHADEEDQEQAREIIAAHLADPSLQQPVFNHPEEHAVDVYNFAISRYESRYIGFASMFYHTGRAWNDRNHDGFHHVQLASSRDMVSWRRLGNRAPFIGTSPLGAGAYDTMQILGPSFPIVRGDQLWFYYSGIRHRWQPEKASPERAAICLATLRRDGFVSLDAGAYDTLQMLGPSSPVIRDDELWFYYTGVKFRWPPTNWDPDHAAICLAALRRDGFVSLDAAAEGGSIVTEPFQWEGERLFINAVADEGAITVEILDGESVPLPGYGQEDAIVLADDSVRQPVAWRAHSSLPDPDSGPIRLRINLTNARAYSYWFE